MSPEIKKELINELVDQLNSQGTLRNFKFTLGTDPTEEGVLRELIRVTKMLRESELKNNPPHSGREPFNLADL